MRKAIVNQNRCIGCGLCCNMCPSVFGIDDIGKAEVINEVSEENANHVQGAIYCCPTHAIKWLEDS